jgi:hypothetical protein
MIISIHQPSYWPWLGHLNKIKNSDFHIILDDVDVKRNSFQYRNIFNNNGNPIYLTLPINKTSRIKINNLFFKHLNWPDEHLKKIFIYYKKSKHFDEVYSIIEPFYKYGRDMKPSDFLISTVKLSMKLLKIETPIINSSELNVNGHKGDRILNLTIKINGTIYLSGKGAKKYLEEIKEQFDKKGIKIIYNNFIHPEYNQKLNLPFCSGLSCLDLLFCEGLENAQKIIKQ